MSLSSASGSPAGDSLKHSDGPWTSASGTAGKLSASSDKSRVRLGLAHESVASAGSGLSAVAALVAVRQSWEERLTSVRGECDYLEGALRTVAKELGEADSDAQKAVRRVKVPREAKSEASR
ncbi:hypothetical protein DVH02_03185 [Streptomyces corynorhini]|uniref:Uncharacterized protein n=1 Tax=Streptomyces corynorhini TaxID=2282652 RepID=A0A370BFX0_9ACTN|nr:hypothetical protein DVH02_03185 [Streptomyces corynorhini]